MTKTGGLKIGINDLYTIDPLTKTQDLFLRDWKNHSVFVLTGFAGTGKTILPVYRAIESVLGGRTYKRVIIIRSAVATRDLGALPGDVNEKGSVYELPYVELCDKLFNKPNAYERLKEQGKIVFSLTSYIRGITFDDSIIVVDEFNNMTFHELYSVMTRLGENSKIAFCGDYKQADEKKNGMLQFMSVLRRMNNIHFTEFSKDDIIRSQLVKEFIIASEECQ